MNIRALKLKDHRFGNEWAEKIEARWNYDDFLRDPRWREDWISFDGVVHHPGKDVVYCGITSFDGDIFSAYERSSGRFINLRFKDAGGRFDAKFHRSMLLSADGAALYLGAALLHDIDRHFEAPGGGIYRHDVASGRTEKLGIPLPHNYIQSLALDEKRGALYAMHFTPERMSRFDLKSGAARDLGPTGSGMGVAQGENLAIDDNGCVWCGWGATRAWQSQPGADAWRLCKYDPHEERIVYYPHGLPRADGGRGTAHVEGLFNLGTGCLYASGGNGSLYRIDTASGRAALLGTPVGGRRSRLTSLALHRDGCAYGITGRDGQCQLLRFDPRKESWELGAPIVDGEGVAMWQCHDVALTPDGVLYAAENDHPNRSSYLWELTL